MTYHKSSFFFANCYKCILTCVLFCCLFLGCRAQAQPEAGKPVPMLQGGLLANFSIQQFFDALPVLNVASAILLDLDSDRVLYTQNADQLIQPASLTKIMTMYLALEQIQTGRVNFKTLVPISAKAAAEPGSRMGNSSVVRCV